MTSSERYAEYRHAIEEELEVLYDAYYEELEQYANYQQRYVNSGGTIPPPPGPGPFPGSVEVDEKGAVVSGIGAGKHRRKGQVQPPPKGAGGKQQALPNGKKHPPSGKQRTASDFSQDEEGEEEYEDDEYEEEEEEEEEEDEGEEDVDDDVDEIDDGRGRKGRNGVGRGARKVNGRVNGRDGFNLRNSLTVAGACHADHYPYRESLSWISLFMNLLALIY